MTLTTPELAAASRTRWGAWIALWIGLIVVQAVLLSDNAALDSWSWRATRWFMGDQDAYQWPRFKAAHAADPNATFFERVDPPLHAHIYKRTEGMWRLFRDLGEPVTTVLLLAVLWVYDRRSWKAPVLLLASTIGSGLVGELVRVIAGRHRPIETGGANSWVLWRGFHEGSNLSWPSGHSTLAFSTAATLVYLSPRGRWLFLVLACGCAAARVVMQAHFWSDVAFGGVLGWSIGWGLTAWTDKRLPDPPPISR